MQALRALILLLSNIFYQFGLHFRRPSPGLSAGLQRGSRCFAKTSSGPGHLPRPASGSATPSRGFGWPWRVPWAFWGTAPGPGRWQDSARRQKLLGLGRPATATPRRRVWVTLGVVILPKVQQPSVPQFCKVHIEQYLVARRQYTVLRFYVLGNWRFIGAIPFIQCLNRLQNHLK